MSLNDLIRAMQRLWEKERKFTITCLASRSLCPNLSQNDVIRWRHKTLIFSLCLFICWTPFVVLHCYRIYILFNHITVPDDRLEQIEYFYRISILLGWTNSAINPIIYSRNKEVWLIVSHLIRTDLELTE